ncbi:MAG TPA: CaiB/BaiF CoA-transferase family protein [Actinomycetota bacterium]|nr:CaiB/BaiF CoA-transferase family protein [Actinomycetota bacterium]
MAGITILDLTRLLPGGYCTLLLADLGADVIKVEEPARGDYIRWTPPLVEGESAAHRALNRGKRSITLNLKNPDGVSLLRKLASRADVLVESFRPGVMARLGVGYEALSEANPQLVYCAITGYGQDGPYRDLVGHDINYLGYGGVLSMTGAPGGPPVVPGVQVGDLGGGGMLAAVGILAALLDRPRSRQGRFIDTSMLDGVVSWLSIHAGEYLATGMAPERGMASLTGGYACYRVYRAGDGGYLTVGALEPQFWEALCNRLRCPELIPDQYAAPERQAEMGDRLQEIFATRNRAEWLDEFRDVPSCVGPVNDLGEALADPQVRHRGMVAEIDGQPVGPGPPLKMSGLPQTALKPAPRLGEHTGDVLAALGVDGAGMDALRADGTV